MPKTAHILIATSDKAVGARLAEGLAQHGYEIHRASESGAVQRIAVEARPDVILLGSFGSPASAFELAQGLRHDSRTVGMPIVLVGGGDLESCRRALALGLDDLVPEDVDIEDLAGRLPRLVRSAVMQADLGLRIDTARDFGLDIEADDFSRAYPENATVFAICDDGHRLSALQETLSDAGFHVVPERNPDRAAERLEDERADALVVAVTPGGNTETVAALCERVRTNPRLYYLPMLVTIDHLDAAQRQTLYRAGAGIVVATSEGDQAAGERLSVYLRMLVNRHRMRWTMRDPIVATRGPATADPDMPQVYRASFFKAHLARHIERTRDRSGHLSVGIVDVSDAVESAASHGAESKRLLLKQLGDWVPGLTRIEDTVARRDEGTFAIIFPNTSADEARLVMDRVAGVLEQSEFHLAEEVMTPLRVWPRIAIASFEEGDEADALIARAEAARA